MVTYVSPARMAAIRPARSNGPMPCPTGPNTSAAVMVPVMVADTTINPAAPVFAGAFLLQALAFVWTGVVGHRLAFAWGRAPRHWVAAGLLLMALAYPVLAQLTVGVGPRAPTFGVPCPTALFTAGCLLAAVPPVPRGLLVIPVLWSLIGGSAALLLGIRIDAALFVAAAASCSSLAPGILERPEPT